MHGNGYHLHAKGFTDGEVSVISWGGAEPFYLFALAPRLGASLYTQKHCASDGIVHKLKAGVSSDDYFVSSYPYHRHEKALSLVNTVQHAIVAAVYAGFGDMVAVQAVGEHIVSEV